MQLELSPTVIGVLAPQASASGVSLVEYVTQLVTNFALVSASRRVAGPEFKIETDHDVIAWVLSRNANLLHNRPEDTDWQALKSEGRRY